MSMDRYRFSPIVNRPVYDWPAGIEATKDPPAGVVDAAGLAMHQVRCANDLAAHGLADGLVTEADAEQRRRRSEAVDQAQANPGFVRGTRPRRQHDGFRRHLLDLVERDLVVADHGRVGAQFAQEVDEIVGEAVVVIDDEEFHRLFLNEGTGWRHGACHAIGVPVHPQPQGTNPSLPDPRLTGIA